MRSLINRRTRSTGKFPKWSTWSKSSRSFLALVSRVLAKMLTQHLHLRTYPVSRTIAKWQTGLASFSSILSCQALSIRWQEWLTFQALSSLRRSTIKMNTRAISSRASCHKPIMTLVCLVRVPKSVSRPAWSILASSHLSSSSSASRTAWHSCGSLVCSYTEPLSMTIILSCRAWAIKWRRLAKTSMRFLIQWGQLASLPRHVGIFFWSGIKKQKDRISNRTNYSSFLIKCSVRDFNASTLTNWPRKSVAINLAWASQNLS